MSETIKAKTSQRLRRKRLGCHLRVSLTSRRNTIVPLLSLLLLLKILADASYPSLLPSKTSFIGISRKKIKKGIQRHPKVPYVHPTEPWPFLLLVHPSEGSWHPPSLRPPARVLVTSQTRCPFCDALLRTASSSTPRAHMRQALYVTRRVTDVTVRTPNLHRTFMLPS